MNTPVLPSGKLRLAFLGDSITVGDADAQARGWPSRLCELTSPLPTKMHCYNLGVGGDCIANLALRAKSELNARLTGRTGCGVVVMIGVNDALRAAATTNPTQLKPEVMSPDLVRILNVARSYGPVLVVEPTPVLPEFEHTDGISGAVVLQKLEQINDVLASVCKAQSVTLVPLTQILQHDPVFTASLRDGDGLHPINTGYECITRHIAATSAWSDFILAAGAN